MPTNRKAVADRAISHLERLRGTTTLNVADFARQVLGVHPSTLYDWRNGLPMSETSATYALRIRRVAVSAEEITIALRPAARGPRYSGKVRATG